ncbi:MAG: thrombospondin type 3 repeat-containing protein [Myxococcota bacterium]
MTRIAMLSLALLTLSACGGEKELDPLADEDGDGFNNGDEFAMGSDPLDESDIPYAGGWVKDAACRKDVQSTGNTQGQVAENFALLDQYGEQWKLHDFCNSVVLVEYSGFT